MKTKWQTERLGDICEIINGSTPLRSNESFWNNGTVPWFTIDDIREQGRIIQYTNQKITEKALGKISARLLPPESILLCCTASVGEYAFTKIPLTTNQQFNGLVIKDKKLLNPTYLFYFSSTLKNRLLGLSGKTTIDFIPISRLKEIEIPFPELSEQKRIVEILEETFENIEKAKESLEKNLQNSKELLESYLQNLFASPGQNWDNQKLIDIFAIKPSKKEAKEKLTDNDLVSFVPMEDMQIMSKEFICSKERTLKEVSGSYTYFANEDVLLAKITPCFENGKLGIARNLKNGIGFGSSEYIVFRSNGAVIPDYLYYFLARAQFIKEGAKRMSGAVGHKRVSKEFIEESVLSFPKSIIEQQAIVKKLDALSLEIKKLEAIYEKKLFALEELKKSILKKAFSGQL